MSAQVLVFDVFANSGKGFMARVLLPNNQICFKDKINAIEYEVYNVTDGGLPVTGSLDPNVVMFSSVQTWKYDSDGYTFLWAVPGSLWPSASKIYRIVIRFEIKDPLTQFHLFTFVLVWEGRTSNPAG